MRTPTPSAARSAMSRGSPLGPSPETSHHTRTPAIARAATGTRTAAAMRPPPRRKGQRRSRGARPRRPRAPMDRPPARRARRPAWPGSLGISSRPRGRAAGRRRRAKRQRRRADPEQDRVDVEVAARAPADAADHPVLARARTACAAPVRRAACAPIGWWGPPGRACSRLLVLLRVVRVHVDPPVAFVISPPSTAARADRLPIRNGP